MSLLRFGPLFPHAPLFSHLLTATRGSWNCQHTNYEKNKAVFSDIQKLAWHSKLDHANLLDIRGLTEYEIQTRLLWDLDKVRQEHIIISSKHRQ